MVSSSQIKEHLALYLADQISLGEFEDWFVPNTRDIRRTRSKAAMAMTFTIEGILSEYLAQILDDRELRSELSQVLHADNRVVEIKDVPQQVFLFRSSAPLAFVLVKA